MIKRHKREVNKLEVPINEIVIAGRFRKEMGSIEALAKSIDEVGLLQPIGVDDNYNLIFGERRLWACRSLGWTTIPVRLVNLDNPLQAEYDENEVRKDFTPSERVDIGRAIENQISRKGSNQHQVVQVQNFAQPLEGEKTRDIAAQKAGFNNPETYRQAKHVVDHAPKEVVEKMDQGEISINKAYNLTKQIEKLPEEEKPISLADFIKQGKEELKRDPAYVVNDLSYKFLIMFNSTRRNWGSFEDAIKDASHNDLSDIVRNLTDIYVYSKEWLDIAVSKLKGSNEIRRVK